MEEYKCILGTRDNVGGKLSKPVGKKDEIEHMYTSI